MELQKSSTILVNGEKPLMSLCVGVNWGAIIRRKLLFGLIPVWENVNLDICVAIFDRSGQMKDLIHPSRLVSRDGAVVHSGDDRTGDRFGDDDEDNEIITIDFTRLESDVEQLVFFLASANRKDFSEIPYSRVRIYEGAKNKVERTLGTYNISAQKSYAGKIAMVMGKLFREPVPGQAGAASQWKFYTIGEGLESEKLLSSVMVIKDRFLNAVNTD